MRTYLPECSTAVPAVILGGDRRATIANFSTAARLRPFPGFNGRSIPAAWLVTNGIYWLSARVERLLTIFTTGFSLYLPPTLAGGV